MSFVSHLSQTANHEAVVGVRSTRVSNIMEDINIPTIELLYWMLRGKSAAAGKGS